MVRKAYISSSFVVRNLLPANVRHCSRMRALIERQPSSVREIRVPDFVDLDDQGVLRARWMTERTTFL